MALAMLCLLRKDIVSFMMTVRVILGIPGGLKIPELEIPGIPGIPGADGGGKSCRGRSRASRRRISRICYILC